MPPGVTVLPWPRHRCPSCCKPPAANTSALHGTAHEAIPPRADTESCFPWGHQLRSPKPCHISQPQAQPRSPTAGRGRRWRCRQTREGGGSATGPGKAVAVPSSACAASHQHSLTLPRPSTKPAAPEPCRGVWPQPRAPVAALLVSPHPPHGVSPQHLPWGKCWGPGPPTWGYLAMARRGGESLLLGWRPPLTAC